jgi:hypothetical protein
MSRGRSIATFADPAGMSVKMQSDAAGRFSTSTVHREQVWITLSSSSYAPLGFRANRIIAGGCKKQAYLMLAVGGGSSFVTLKKTDLPKVKR